MELEQLKNDGTQGQGQPSLGDVFEQKNWEYNVALSKHILLKNISTGWVLISIFSDRPYRSGWNKPISKFPFGRFSGAAAVVHKKDRTPTIMVLIELFKTWCK